MNLGSRLTATLAAAAFAVCAPAFAEKMASSKAHPASEAKADEAKKDIVDTAVAAGQFKTLTKLVTEAGLAETLKGAGPFTVFAPTDDAFAKIPAATLEVLQKPENKEKLKGILTYHVVAKKVTAEDAKGLDGKSAPTVNGAEIKIKVEDGKVKINDSTVIKADVMASNGVIHVIDTVLMPPSDSAKK